MHGRCGQRVIHSKAQKEAKSVASLGRRKTQDLAVGPGELPAPCRPRAAPLGAPPRLPGRPALQGPSLQAPLLHNCLRVTRFLLCKRDLHRRRSLSGPRGPSRSPGLTRAPCRPRGASRGPCGAPRCAPTAPVLPAPLEPGTAPSLFSTHRGQVPEATGGCRV